jgi:dTMP kinase
MKKGKLIVIEGACDGIGKTTQFKMLCDHLTKDGYTIINHHFPTYNTYQGAPVEHYLSGDFGNPSSMSPYFIHNLYALDRAVTWRTKLVDSYNKGCVILLDRYTTSSLIYQASTIKDIEERKSFLDFVEDYEYNKLEIKKPDNVIFLTADFDVVTKLRNERKDNEGIENDIHERDLEYMRNVYDNAVFVAKYLKWDIINCDKDGRFKSRDDIHEEIYKLISKK